MGTALVLPQSNEIDIVDSPMECDWYAKWEKIKNSVLNPEANSNRIPNRSPDSKTPKALYAECKYTKITMLLSCYYPNLWLFMLFSCKFKNTTERILLAWVFFFLDCIFGWSKDHNFRNFIMNKLLDYRKRNKSLYTSQVYQNYLE